jgi:transcriptional regulator GlxA family with amidase domain
MRSSPTARSTRNVLVVAYDGFNELDLFANLHILNRVRRVRPDAGLVAQVAAPSETVTSMYGVRVTVQQPLAAVAGADAVVVGSGGTLVAVEDPAFMSGLRLDPRRQVVGSQCSGALVLARLGLLDHQPACTDDRTRPHLEAAGVTALDQPFAARGNVGTAGGCLSAAHLSAWIIVRLVDAGAAADTLAEVAPVGHQATFVAEVMQALDATGAAV